MRRREEDKDEVRKMEMEYQSNIISPERVNNDHNKDSLQEWT